jgi:hypothetical protein
MFQVHEIKFDEYGIMDDGLDESTASQLARSRAAATVNGTGAAAAAAAVDGATAAPATVIDEDLFDDEDLDELEEDLDKLDI